MEGENSKVLKLSVVSPSRTLFEGEALYVQIPTYDGLIGVLPGHAPLISVLGYGMMRARIEEKKEESFLIAGGFLEIINNRITVLANSVEYVEEIDIEQAQKDFDAALDMVTHNEEEAKARQEKLALARARLRNAVTR